MSAAGDSDVDDGQGIAAGVFTIDPARSGISFRTRAMWGLLGVRGTFSVESGKVEVGEPATTSTVEAVVSAASFASGIPQRDEHVRSSDYLDVANHPRIVFVSDRFEWTGTRGTLQGRLTVRDVTRPVKLDVTSVTGGERELTARATTTIDRFDFEVTTARGMTGRKLQLTLDVVATR
ncbi:YceI family protein [Actinoalloteichus sp. AHMU CJ021]|uniref:Polyisoprenoid-binding protein YceI n=1 Tax=Actinoalloteichus caeruleus DSM 43889 TaxID=1120930 RepID=A0ABT1JFR9_ACTCY|nr:YceI family protein [Actinoalloteichus caeruleus]AUS81195.1 YceI family protein [Actinoalloteichus sp. AHMU CJ021]MCP2330626.1 Polyisoprenoid-binding protein YceI [Actinoalloteichus caeruleus DSM 43889]